jgi:regulator of cell morphogenesis and NO signaling
MIDDFDIPISELVQQDYRMADVFKKHQLSFCCSREILLKSACEARKLDYELVVNELQDATRNIQVSNSLPFGEWKTDFLIDFISNIHHEYIYRVMPVLKNSLQSFALGHQKNYPEFTAVAQLFEKLSVILFLHNTHEDEIIFPYIKQIDTAYRRKEPYGNLFVRTLRKPLNNIEREHVQILELLKGLKTMTQKFTIPEKACVSFGVLYKKLEEFYNNLMQHKYLEHKILFPKALAIEQNLLQT